MATPTAIKKEFKLEPNPNVTLKGHATLIRSMTLEKTLQPSWETSEAEHGFLRMLEKIIDKADRLDADEAKALEQSMLISLGRILPEVKAEFDAI